MRKKTKKLYQLLTRINKILDQAFEKENRKKSGKELLSKDSVADCYEMLTNICCGCTKMFMSSIDKNDESADKYAECLFLNIYMVVATCLLFLQEFWPVEENNLFYEIPSNILFAKDHQLAVTDEVPICDFNIQELVATLESLELNKHNLQFCEDLVMFVDALEIRVAEILLSAFDTETHNVSKYCGEKDGLMYATTSLEYKLAILITSIHIDLATSLQNLRTLRVEGVDQIEYVLAKQIKDAMQQYIEDIYGDKVQNEFATEYLMACATTSEGYRFIMHTTFDIEIDPSLVIPKARTVAEYNILVAKARQSIKTVFENAVNDMIAFKVLFNIIMKYIVLQVTYYDWNLCRTTGADVSCFSADKFEKFKHHANNHPIFVEAYGDVGVFHGKEFVIFGRTPEDYFLALKYWMQCIILHHNGFLSKNLPIRPLVEFFFNDGERVAPAGDMFAMNDIQKELDEIYGDSEDEDDIVYDYEEEEELESENRSRPSSSSSSSSSGISLFNATTQSNYFHRIFTENLKSIEAFKKIQATITNCSTSDLNDSYTVIDDEDADYDNEIKRIAW